MSSIRNFFHRAKRKILRDCMNVFRNAYYNSMYRDAVKRGDIMLNIGAGGWHCDGWTNLDYPSEWYSKAQKKNPFIPYDIRSDKIPFESDTVRAVYSSHVIEHIEDKYIQAFFADVYRVLMPGGVFRIACPDVEFLYNVSRFANEYWHWRIDWFQKYTRLCENGSPKQCDYLVREIATPRLLTYIYGNPAVAGDFSEELASMGMEEFMQYLTSGIEYREDVPGDHINWWTFGKTEKFLKNAGFSIVIRSKYMGSMCRAMCNPAKFDTTCKEMSLYVEAVK